jgi:hypothetical protein
MIKLAGIFYARENVGLLLNNIRKNTQLNEREDKPRNTLRKRLLLPKS